MAEKQNITKKVEYLMHLIFLKIPFAYQVYQMLELSENSPLKFKKRNCFMTDGLKLFVNGNAISSCENNIEIPVASSSKKKAKKVKNNKHALWYMNYQDGSTRTERTETEKTADKEQKISGMLCSSENMKQKKMGGNKSDS